MSRVEAIRVVVLSGAGISAESGVRTFRASDGLWEEHRIEDVATPEGYRSNPALVHDFYNARRAQLGTVKPNDAHLALAAYERERKSELLVITQNIDDLHERAGSRKVLHMHGELNKAHCDRCGQVTEARGDLHPDSCCSHCTGGRLRPHVVWFGEMPLHLERIYAALERCTVFIAVGTSGNVYPAAGFCDLARMAGARCLEVNVERTIGSNRFHETMLGPAGKALPKLLAKLA